MTVLTEQELNILKSMVHKKLVEKDMTANVYTKLSILYNKLEVDPTKRIPSTYNDNNEITNNLN